MSVTKGKSVLIVDDSTELLKLIDKILTNVGISTYTATSVSEAWKAIESSAPHAIITDLNMEPESGFVLLEKLKNNKKYATIPVIVLSAQGDRVAIHQAFGLGAKEYVKKPLDAALILQKENPPLFPVFHI
jgi:twitching motility two-component system response regulator PilH